MLKTSMSSMVNYTEHLVPSERSVCRPSFVLWQAFLEVVAKTSEWWLNQSLESLVSSYISSKLFYFSSGLLMVDPINGSLNLS